MQENLLSLWKRHFVLADGILMLKVSYVFLLRPRCISLGTRLQATTLTPYSVLKASGHVDKFEARSWIMWWCDQL